MLGLRVVAGVSVRVEAEELPSPDAGFTAGLPEVAGGIDVARPVFAGWPLGQGVFAGVESAVAVYVSPEPAAASGWPAGAQSDFSAFKGPGAEDDAGDCEVAVHAIEAKIRLATCRAGKEISCRPGCAGWCRTGGREGAGADRRESGTGRACVRPISSPRPGGADGSKA